MDHKHFYTVYMYWFHASTLGSRVNWRLQNNTAEPTVVSQVSRVLDCTVAFKDSQTDVVKGIMV